MKKQWSGMEEGKVQDTPTHPWTWSPWTHAAMCRIIVSFTRVYRVGVWLGFVRFALLLAVVLYWVDPCFGSWVLLGLFCLLRVSCNTDALVCNGG